MKKVKFMTEKQLGKKKMKERTAVIERSKQIFRQTTESSICNYSMYVDLYA